MGTVLRSAGFCESVGFSYLHLPRQQTVELRTEGEKKPKPKQVPDDLLL